MSNKVVARRNSSLTAMQIDLLRRVDLIDVPKCKRNLVLKKLVKFRLDGDTETTTVFNPEQRRHIEDVFRESNQRLFSEYFEGQDVFGSFHEKNSPNLLTASPQVDAYVDRLRSVIGSPEWGYNFIRYLKRQIFC